MYRKLYGVERELVIGRDYRFSKQFISKVLESLLQSQDIKFCIIVRLVSGLQDFILFKVEEEVLFSYFFKVELSFTFVVGSFQVFLDYGVGVV